MTKLKDAHAELNKLIPTGNRRGMYYEYVKKDLWRKYGLKYIEPAPKQRSLPIKRLKTLCKQ